MRCFLAMALVAIFAPAVGADAKIKAVEDEIEKLEKKLGQLRTDLANLRKAKVNPANLINLLPDDFAVGQVGRIGQGKSLYLVDIQEIINKQEMVMRLRGTPRVPFIVRGKSTKNLAEGKSVQLPGIWHVEGTKKHRGRTYYLLQFIEE